METAKRFTCRHRKKPVCKDTAMHEEERLSFSLRRVLDRRRACIKALSVPLPFFK
jgi:hypothetical protein